MIRQRINKSDTLHQIYSNHKIKQQLIDYIFSVVDLSKFKYRVLKTKEDLSLLTEERYHISGNYTGTNCLMIFTRNKDRFYSFLIDRKTLSYRQSQVNIDNVSIYPIELGLEESIYEGTILDGIFSQTEKSKIFVVSDVYLFRGSNLMHDKIKYKLINIKSYFDSYSTHDKNINNIDVLVNNLYNISEIKNLVQNIIPHTKILQVRGITFYPEESGTKLIYLFNEQSGNQEHNTHQFNERSENQRNFTRRSDTDYRSNKPIQQGRFRENTSPNENISPEEMPSSQTQKVKYRYVSKIDEPIVLTFELRKTEQCDVYKLFLISKSIEEGKSVLKMKRIGMACIPTIACSKMCKDAVMQTGKALIKCAFDENKEKWIPMECDKKKKCPDLVSTLEEKMDIIVDEES